MDKSHKHNQRLNRIVLYMMMSLFLGTMVGAVIQ